MRDFCTGEAQLGGERIKEVTEEPAVGSLARLLHSTAALAPTPVAP